MFFESKLKRLAKKLRRLHNQKKNVVPFSKEEKEIREEIWKLEEEIRKELRKTEFIKVSHPDEVAQLIHSSDI